LGVPYRFIATQSAIEVPTPSQFDSGSSSLSISKQEAIANVKNFLRTTEWRVTHSVIVQLTATPSGVGSFRRSCDDGTKTVGCRPHADHEYKTSDRACIDTLDALATSWSASGSEARWTVTAILNREIWGKTELHWDFFPSALIVSPYPDQKC
tara:strand:+ start:2325 stop:2783 length:459 start_codon:yes stop_codon:yes gene_type:complete